MFTLKFYQHNSEAHEVFSCERYSVSEERREPETPEELERPMLAPMLTTVRMYRVWDDDNPHFETVGDREPYVTAYIVNEIGRTIDTIR